METGGGSDGGTTGLGISMGRVAPDGGPRGGGMVSPCCMGRYTNI